MKKHIAVIFLIGSMALIMCGCGSKGKEEIYTITDTPLTGEEVPAEEHSAEGESGLVEEPFDKMEGLEAENGQEKDLQKIKENARKIVAEQEEIASALEASLENDPLTQTELNEKSYQLYEAWDYALNSVWQALREVTEEEEMNRLVIEEREWIKIKEQAVADAGAEVVDGSIYPLVTSLKAAELTKLRVYELLEMLK